MSFCKTEKPKTRSELQNINISKPGRFDLVGLGFAGCDKHFSRECALFKPLLHVFKKKFLWLAARRQQADVHYANGGIENLSVENSFRTAITAGMNYGRPSKIIQTFLWRHKFPLGCGGLVRKFPIQSLLLSMPTRSVLKSNSPLNTDPMVSGFTLVPKAPLQ